MTNDKLSDTIKNSAPSDWVKLSDIDEKYLTNITGIFKVVGENIDLAIKTDNPAVFSKRFDTVDFYSERVNVQVYGLDSVHVYMPKKNMLDLAKHGDIVYNVEALNGKVYDQMMVAKDALIGVNSNGDPITLPKTGVKSFWGK